MARVLLGVSGGIAAYKALEFARLATRDGHNVRVLMTPAAQRFIGAISFEGITGSPVLSDEFDRDPMRGAFPGDETPRHDPIGHLELASNAEVFLIAPASANTIAKLAAGLADSILTTSFLACTAPRIVAPAMNDLMYRDAATQANLTTLAQRAVIVLDPGEGPLASRGEHGVGRLPEPAELLAAVEAALPAVPGAWDGLRVLVSAGGTQEPIDPVRFIGNRSSGRMGFALAERAASRGAAVTVVAANVVLPTPRGVDRIEVGTANQMRDALAAEFDSADVLLMAAAPADFQVAEIAESKLPRGVDAKDLRLVPTDDILARLSSSRRPGQTIIGFAAETSDADSALSRAREKLERKGVDAIVLNDVSRPEIGFESKQNEVVIVEAGSEHHLPLASKTEIADAILDHVAALRSASQSRKR